MSEPGGLEAGPLYVDVVADTTGFGRDLQAKVNAATARVKATIQADIDDRKAQAQLAAIERKQRQVQIQANIDDAKAQATLAAIEAKRRVAEIQAEAQTATAEAALDRVTNARRVATIRAEADVAAAEARLDQAAAKKRTVQIQAAIEDAAAQAELQRIEAKRRIAEIQAEADTLNAERKLDEAAKKREATIQANADTEAAKLELDEAAHDRVVKYRIDVDGSGLTSVGSTLQSIGTGAVGLLQFPAIAAGISMAAQAVIQLAGGLASVVAAAAPAVGVLAAIPGLAAGAAQGVGAVVVGFMGIANAVKASATAQAQSAATGSVAAAQRAAAAARIVAAQDQVQQSTMALRNAEENAARSISQAQQGVVQAHQEAARAVTQAEQQLTTAQREATQAQLALTRARLEATRQLQDMNNSLVDARNSTEQAGIDVQRAQITRTQVFASPTSTALDREQADLSYREAVQRLKEQQLQTQRLTSDTAKANQAGVEGSDLVVKAKQAVLDANNRVIASEQALRQAEEQGAQRIAQAEATLANARRAAAFSIESAQHQVLLSERNLSAAQAAATTQTAKQTAANTALATAMNNLSPAGRTFVGFLNNTLIPAWDAVQKATQQALLPPVQRGLQAVLPLLAVLRGGLSTTAAIIGASFERLTTTYLATPLFRRDFATILDANNRAFRTLSDVPTLLARALTDVVVASEPLIQRFSQFIAYSAQIVSAWIHTQRETGNLSRMFQLAGDTAGVLWRIVRDLAVAIFNIGRAAYPAGRDLLNSFAGVVATFRAWTTSLSGQNALRDYFAKSADTLRAVGRLVHDLVVDLFSLGRGNSMAPLIDQIRTQVLPVVLTLAQTLNRTFGPALIQLVSDLARTLGDLSNAGGGGLTSFVTTLDAMVNTLDRLVRIPGLGPVIATILSLAGSLAAISLVAGPVVGAIGRVVGAMGGLAVEMGLVDAEAGTTTGAMALLGATMDVALGPIGLIVLGLSALGVGLYELYQHWAPFRRVVDDAAGALKNFGTWLWGDIVTGIERIGQTQAWQFVSHGIGDIGTAMVDLGRILRGPAGASWSFIESVVGKVGQAFVNLGVLLRGAAGGIASYVESVTGKVGRMFANLGTMAVDTWHFLQRAFGGIGTATGSLRDMMAAAFSRIGGAFSGLSSSLTDTWHRGIDVVYGWVKAGANTVRDTIGRAVNTASAFFTGLGNNIRNVWNRIISVVWAAIRSGITAVQVAIANAANRIGGSWNAIANVINGVWRNFISPVFTAIRTALSRVQSAFGTAVTAIGRLWDGLRAAVANPVRFVIDTVYNNGIRAIWNKVAGLVHLPQLPAVLVQGINATASGRAFGTGSAGAANAGRAFARGGVLPGYAPGVDSEYVLMSPGEGVLVPEAVRGLARLFGMSAERAVQALNSAFSSRVSAAPGRTSTGGTPAFDLGGVLGWVAQQINRGAAATQSFVSGALGGALNALANVVRGALSGPLHAAAGPLHNLINSVLGAQPPFTGMLRNLMNSGLDKAVDYITGQDAKVNATAAAGGNVTGTPVANVGSGVERWRGLVVQVLGMVGLNANLADRVLRQIATESGGNPNAVQGNIGDINNRTGDLAKGLIQVIGATFRAYHWPGTSWNVFDPTANLAAGLNYAKQRYGSSLSFLGQGHGYSLGGVVPALGRRLLDAVNGAAPALGRLLDSGGWLQPGATLAVNATGQPEAVFTSTQWDTLRQIVTSATSARIIRDDGGAPASSGPNITIPVQAGPGMDTRLLARQVASELAWQMRGA